MADACALPIKDGSCPVVVDKGTLDALCSSGDDKASHAAALLSELWRVTTADGVVLLFSILCPEDRLPLMRAAPFPWDISVTVIDVAPLELPSQPTMWMYVSLCVLCVFFLTRRRDHGCCALSHRYTLTK